MKQAIDNKKTASCEIKVEEESEDNQKTYIKLKTKTTYIYEPTIECTLIDEDINPLPNQRVKITFQGKTYIVEEAKPESFDGINIVLASAGGSTSQKFAPEIVKRGGVLIDNSSAFRMEKDVPLVISVPDASQTAK